MSRSHDLAARRGRPTARDALYLRVSLPYSTQQSDESGSRVYSVQCILHSRVHTGSLCTQHAGPRTQAHGTHDGTHTKAYTGTRRRRRGLHGVMVVQREALEPLALGAVGTPSERDGLRRRSLGGDPRASLDREIRMRIGRPGG